MTTVLEVVAIVLIAAGAVALGWGAVLISFPLGLVVVGLVGALIGVGMLWISKRVTQ